MLHVMNDPKLLSILTYKNISSMSKHKKKRFKHLFIL